MIINVKESLLSVFATENVNQLNVDDDKNKNRIVVATNYNTVLAYSVL